MKQYLAKDNHLTGALYLVATPIGNLSDISERAVGVLRGVDFIAAEDTRVTRKLLFQHKIKKPLISYRMHNRNEAGEAILARVMSGESCAMVTDAGTPCISDPGGDLVRLFYQTNIPVSVIPGPCAAIAGLVLSGFPANRFAFEGFLPANRGKRLSHLKELINEQRTMVFYEAPHKLLQTLNDMYTILGDRHLSVSREITKLYEETLRLTLSEAVTHYTATQPRGEFVLVVEGADYPHHNGTIYNIAIQTAKVLISSGMSARDAVKKAARITGCSENNIYKAVLVKNN